MFPFSTLTILTILLTLYVGPLLGLQMYDSIVCLARWTFNTPTTHVNFALRTVVVRSSSSRL